MHKSKDKDERREVGRQIHEQPVSIRVNEAEQSLLWMCKTHFIFCISHPGAPVHPLWLDKSLPDILVSGSKSTCSSHTFNHLGPWEQLSFSPNLQSTNAKVRNLHKSAPKLLEQLKIGVFHQYRWWLSAGLVGTFILVQSTKSCRRSTAGLLLVLWAKVRTRQIRSLFS